MPRTLRNRPTSLRASRSVTTTSHSTYHGRDQATEALLSATVEELRALTVRTLRQHLAAHNLPSSGTKAILAYRLYNAIHGESLPAENPTSSPVTASSTSYTITQPTEAANLESFTPTQILAMLQLLSQALQTRVSQPQTNATSSQSLENTPPIFSTAQQHSRALTTQSLIDPSISLHPNDDALSTASSMLQNAGVTQTDPLGPVLSQSLPPVPVALRQRILKGEYIDFSTLLPEVMFSVATSTPSPNAGRFTGQSPRITSFSTWLDAWNIYIAIVVAHNPSRASELLGY